MSDVIEIWGKPDCRYCTRAISFCTDNKLPFRYYSLGKDYTKEELLERFPSARTFPVVIVRGEYIGGFDQLSNYDFGDGDG